MWESSPIIPSADRMKCKSRSKSIVADPSTLGRHVCYVCKRSVCGGDEPQPVAHLSHKLQCARQSLKIMVSYGNKYPRHNARPHVVEQSGQCAWALRKNGSYENKAKFVWQATRWGSEEHLVECLSSDWLFNMLDSYEMHGQKASILFKNTAKDDGGKVLGSSSRARRSWRVQ